MDLPQPGSLWLETTESTDFPELEEAVSTDVAVVGGGIAGLTVAYMLDRKGYKVTVVESRRVVEGVTGHTTAKLTSLHGLKYRYLISAFGEEKAEIYAESNQEAIEEVERITQEEDIDCGFTRAPAYTFTREKERRSQVHEEVLCAKKLGLPATFEDSIPLPFEIEAAVKFENQAYFHPRKYLLGLIDSFSYQVDIFEGTSALGIEGTTVKTDKGELNADKVVVTSHFPFEDSAFYFAREFPHHSYLVAAEVENAPEVMVYGIESEPFRSYRPGDGLALVGGQGHKTGQGGDTESRYEKLSESMGKIFDPGPVKYIWSTQDYTTMDRVPYIGNKSPMSEDVYIATGFGGWGMTNGTVAGILLADRIDGTGNEWSKLYSPNRLPPRNAVSRFFRENADNVKVLLSDWLRGRESSFRSLDREEARVMEIDGEKVATYRDENGDLHSFSAVCNHLGCTVRWNNAEKTWDCPCHGSRYSYDGTVVHGPAKEDLDEKDP